MRKRNSRQDLQRRLLTRREFLLLSAGAVAGAAVSACAGAPSPTPTVAPPATTAPKATPVPAAAAPVAQPSGATPPSKPKAPLPKIAVGAVAPPWSIQIVTLIPVAKGFFKEEGFPDVEYKVLSPATNVAAVISGEVDFVDGMGTEEVLRVRSKGEEMYILGGRVNMNTMAFFGAKGMKSMQDLKGKTVGISAPGSKTDIVTRAGLAHAKLDAGKDVLLVPSGSTQEAFGALTTGRIQGAVFISSQIPVLQAQGYPMLLHMSDVYKDYQSNVMVTMGKTIQKNPDAVLAYVKAMVRTYQYMHDKKNWPEIKQILKDSKQQFEEQYFEATMEVLLPAIPKDGSVNQKGVEYVANMEKELGTVDKSLDVGKVYRLDFLEKAQKELGITKS